MVEWHVHQDVLGSDGNNSPQILVALKQQGVMVALQPTLEGLAPQGPVAEPGQPWLHLPPEAPSGWSTVSQSVGQGKRE